MENLGIVTHAPRENTLICNENGIFMDVPDLEIIDKFNEFYFHESGMQVIRAVCGCIRIRCRSTHRFSNHMTAISGTLEPDNQTAFENCKKLYNGQS